MLYCDHLLELQLDYWPIQDTPKTNTVWLHFFTAVHSYIHIYILISSEYQVKTLLHYLRLPLLYLQTKPECSSCLFFVRFSSHSSTTREHCLCQRLEPEVQEGHFTSKIKMKQRHGSSHCVKNCTRQEQKMVGAKNRSAEQLNALTCPKQ